MVGATGPTGPVQGLAVLRALAQEPRAVVADLTGPDVDASALPAELDLIENYLGHWDATALLVCADTLEKERVLQAHPLGARLTLFPAVAFALVAAGRQIPTDRLVLPLASVPAAPGQARHFVRSALEQWRLRYLLNEAELVVTELVTNTVVHAHTPMTLTISRRNPTAPPGRGTLRIAVRDTDHDSPAPHPPDLLRPDGRGLQLIDHFTAAWGAISLDDGKIVWTVLQQDPATA
ncbi:ATP-binding protein [Segeticoccus rhizosphaerae]|uniref:ATP-binding protein n=1 Tax=Segeticoccus rhizosphaerae TaxID=1104777 RepID=UPI0010BF79BF|nr:MULTISPECIES: ATP-binding protein [Intrasporangiaceae]